MDEELLRDFLIEAGELIDGIDAQVVRLEQAPDDRAVLNGIFRAFHTIKGGAGFLGLKPLVELCHRVEDLLNLSRSGERSLDAAHIDLILEAVDEVKRMFAEVDGGAQPRPVRDRLLSALAAAAQPGAAPAAPPVTDDAPAPAAAADAPDEAPADGGDPVLARFEEMLRAAAPAAAPPAPTPASDEITEDEFDALIDAIQRGEAVGAAPPAPEAPPAAAAAETAVPPPEPPAPPPAEAEAAAYTGPERRVGADPGYTGPERRADAAARPLEHSLRVDAARVDGVMNLVGELVLVRNRLASLRMRVQDDDLNRTLSRLNLVTADLQASVMRLRMQPVHKVFGRFHRVVRDLAAQLGKEVELEMRGESTELDKGMVEALTDPLVHLVRNAIDHGIEAPDERERAGKPRAGRLVLSAHQEGSHIYITVSDDGAGLDAALIRRKAVDKGLVDPRAALQLSDVEAFKLLFLPGFSTRSAISDISGRGVGMDVVKSQIAQVNGSVEIHSEKGRGTRVVMRLPLTLAILPALMVVAADRCMALPLPVVEEIVDFAADDCSTMDGKEVLSLRGEVLPLIDLARWVGGPADAARGRMFVVVANTGARRVGLLVHKLLGQEDVVIKSLGARLQGLPGLAGATITGDGGIALIVDVGTLFASWQGAAPFVPARSAA
ncbi:MAG TPA: chemotaxis protein CheA [Gammaproteobacteria bacterium]